VESSGLQIMTTLPLESRNTRQRSRFLDAALRVPLVLGP
jgi:hypothetical protein